MNRDSLAAWRTGAVAAILAALLGIAGSNTATATPAGAAHRPHADVPVEAAQAYKLTVTEEAPPGELDEALRAHVADSALTVSTAADEPIMDIWFAEELPAPDSPPVDPAVAYGSLNEGVVLAVMRFHREHRDFRDQSVPAGTYVARYLRQPNDGNHLGETTYRDFAVLVPPTTGSPGPQRFDVTLGQALQLNTHPFVWGLWPADFVSVAAEPGIASFDADKWAVKLSLPRADGSTLTIALTVVGNERHYY